MRASTSGQDKGIQDARKYRERLKGFCRERLTDRFPALAENSMYVRTKAPVDLYLKFIVLLSATVNLLSFALAQPLDSNWWQNLSPEAILKRAESVTANAGYLIGSKSRTVNDPQSGFQFFQRRTGEGKAESKLVVKRGGQIQSVSYDLSYGKYLSDSGGLLFRLEFEEDYEIEDRIAGAVNHPYEYKILDPSLVGTNECVVVRRSMTQAMLDACAGELYKEKTSQEITKLAPKYIRAVKDVYIRKYDGVIIGYYKRSFSGLTVLVDRLCDDVVVGISIPPEEFLVPQKEPVVAASSFEAFASISSSNKFRKMPDNPANTTVNRRQWITRVLLAGSALVPVTIIVILARQRIRRRATHSAALSKKTK